jgi:hypothetical protein
MHLSVTERMRISMGWIVTWLLGFSVITVV